MGAETGGDLGETGGGCGDLDLGCRFCGFRESRGVGSLNAWIGDDESESLKALRNWLRAISSRIWVHERPSGCICVLFCGTVSRQGPEDATS